LPEGVNTRIPSLLNDSAVCPDRTIPLGCVVAFFTVVADELGGAFVGVDL
jgi:hypothetical protein